MYLNYDYYLKSMLFNIRFVGILLCLVYVQSNVMYNPINKFKSIHINNNKNHTPININKRWDIKLPDYIYNVHNHHKLYTSNHKYDMYTIFASIIYMFGLSILILTLYDFIK